MMLKLPDVETPAMSNEEFIASEDAIVRAATMQNPFIMAQEIENLKQRINVIEDIISWQTIQTTMPTQAAVMEQVRRLMSKSSA